MHFQREHQVPVHCVRCSQTFKSQDDKDKHQREDPPCEVLTPLTWDGIDEVKQRQLKKRVPKGNTVVENWNLIYRILFPDSPLPESPCKYLLIADHLFVHVTNLSQSLKISIYQMIL